MKERGIFLKRFRKVLIVLLAILVPVSIGFGFNFFSGESSDSAENRAMTVAGTLTVNKISEAQNLVPGDKICDGVTMNIKSSAVSLLRVKVDIYYAEVGSTEYTVTTDIASIKNAGDNWLKGSDGYYYYANGVKNGNTVTLASDGIYFNAAEDEADNKDEDSGINMNKYQGKKIKVVANAELIQAKYGVFKDAWGLDQNVDKDIYNKLLAVSNTENNTTKSE